MIRDCSGCINSSLIYACYFTRRSATGEKSALLEELVELSGYQRKSVVRLLEVLWEGGDHLSGKRLAAGSP